jgi:hypothetical protein
MGMRAAPTHGGDGEKSGHGSQEARSDNNAHVVENQGTDCQEPSTGAVASPVNPTP